MLQRTRCSYFRDTSYDQCNKRVPGSGCAVLDGANRGHAVLGASDRCIAPYAGNWTPALIALDTQVEVLGRSGGRTLAFADLHRLRGYDPAYRDRLKTRRSHHGFHHSRQAKTALFVPEDP